MWRVVETNCSVISINHFATHRLCIECSLLRSRLSLLLLTPHTLPTYIIWHKSTSRQDARCSEVSITGSFNRQMTPGNTIQDFTECLFTNRLVASIKPKLFSIIDMTYVISNFLLSPGVHNGVPVWVHSVSISGL